MSKSSWDLAQEYWDNNPDGTIEAGAQYIRDRRTPPVKAPKDPAGVIDLANMPTLDLNWSDKPLPAGEVRTESATGGQKGSKLARFDLIPAHQLWRLAEHYGKGAEKYSDDNYRKGYEWKYSIAALERHLSLFKQGEDIDEETGSLHVIAIAWHAFTLAEFFDIHPDYDTRLKTVDARAVRARTDT